MRRSFGRCYLVLTVLLCVSASFVAAQIIVDPRVVEFQPSPDHDAVGVNGQPLVTAYELEFYLGSTTTPFLTISLGKPSPGPDGFIRANFESALEPVPTPGPTYVARVVAVGPGGTGRSTPSNGFTFQAGSCSVSPNPATLALGGGATTGTVLITAPAGCPWTATSSMPWVTITTSGSGSGNGSFGYSVAANTTSAPRSAAIAVGGQSIPLTQAGASCVFTLAQTNANAQPAGSAGTVAVSALSGCSWTAASNASWITVTGGASGSGSGTVSYSVAAYAGTTPRTGTITIAGRTFTITQNGVTCSFTVAPQTQAVPVAGGAMTVSVTAPSACAWTAAENVNWITITSGGSGSGNGIVRYTVVPNPAPGARSATLTVAGHGVAVTQAGAPCTFTVAPAAQAVARAGGAMSATVFAPAGCSWTATESASWIAISSGASGSGNGTVRYTVSNYTGTASRTSTITIAGRALTVTQSAPVPPSTPRGLRITR